MPRSVDILVAFSGIVLTMPLMILIACALWISQGRPVAFTQMRSGLHGQPFKLHKFRTMTDARDRDGKLLSDEERVTWLGKALRRTRLDELPQLWHILRGDMSFVGPRPVFPETVATFGDLGDRRGSVRPGLTGWAQVNGNALLDHEAKMAMDVWYVDHRSIWRDLQIIAKTVRVIIFGEQVRREYVDEALSYALSSRSSR